MKQMWNNRIRLALLFSGMLCVLSMTSGCLATSVFNRLAIAPNQKKVEFGNRGPAGARWMTKPVVLQGEYLGKEESNGVLMNHYQFAGLLEGRTESSIFPFRPQGTTRRLATKETEPSRVKANLRG